MIIVVEGAGCFRNAVSVTRGLRPSGRTPRASACFGGKRGSGLCETGSWEGYSCTLRQPGPELPTPGLFAGHPRGPLTQGCRASLHLPSRQGHPGCKGHSPVTPAGHCGRMGLELLPGVPRRGGADPGREWNLEPESRTAGLGEEGSGWQGCPRCPPRPLLSAPGGSTLPPGEEKVRLSHCDLGAGREAPLGAACEQGGSVWGLT